MLQFNIRNVIFVIVKDSNQFYSLNAGSWCSVPTVRNEPKINSFDTVSRTTTVPILTIAMRDFRYVVLTYSPTHIHTNHTYTHRNKVIAITALTTQYGGAENNVPE